MDNFTKVVLLAGLVAIVLILTFCYEDERPALLYKKTICRLGLHKMTAWINGRKIRKYTCAYCKKRRNGPIMEVIQGDRKYNPKLKL